MGRTLWETWKRGNRSAALFTKHTCLPFAGVSKFCCKRETHEIPAPNHSPRGLPSRLSGHVRDDGRGRRRPSRRITRRQESPVHSRVSLPESVSLLGASLSCRSAGLA